jgi:hypothetical protein
VETSNDGLNAWSVAATPTTANATISGFSPSTTHYFRVRALYPDGDSDATNALSATTLTAVQGWRIAKLGSANAPMLGDVDHDGMAELLEYAFGLDPQTPDPGGPITSLMNISGTNFLAVTFTRDLTASDATVTVQTSDDLHAWHDGSSYGPGGIIAINSYTTQVSRIQTGNMETIKVRANAPFSAGTQFIRLKVDI